LCGGGGGGDDDDDEEEEDEDDYDFTVCCRLTALTDMLQVFEDWNKGELDSFLIEITKDILKFKDSDGGYSTLCCRYTTLQVFYA